MGLNLCDRCAADCSHHRDPREIVVECGAYKPPMTNADRIRSMSDEELAERIWPKFGCPEGKNHVTCGYVGECKDCWIGWLQQPAEEDT